MALFNQFKSILKVIQNSLGSIMRIILICFLFVSQLQSQEYSKKEFIDQLWNDEIIVKRKHQLNLKEVFIELYRAGGYENCWSKDCYYINNILQNPDWSFYGFYFEHIVKEKVNANTYELIKTLDPDTGEKLGHGVFYIHIIEQVPEERTNEESSIINFREIVNQKLKIAKYSVDQGNDGKYKTVPVLDSCLNIYKIQFNDDGSFKHGYAGQNKCECKTDATNLIELSRRPSCDKMKHYLSSNSGKWQIRDDYLFLRLSDREFMVYDLEVHNQKIILSDSQTRFVLEVE